MCDCDFFYMRNTLSKYLRCMIDATKHTSVVDGKLQLNNAKMCGTRPMTSQEVASFQCTSHQDAWICVERTCQMVLRMGRRTMDFHVPHHGFGGSGMAFTRQALLLNFG